MESTESSSIELNPVEEDPNVNNLSPISYNPSISDDLKPQELEKIKGDAIGDTLYSSRFVLKTLIKLINYETQNEKPLQSEFEKELCTLWDMTIERDVVKLLLDHSVLELFSTIIQATEDQRLTEILVGIIGNMCCLSQTRDTLCVSDNAMFALLNLVSCSDSLILVQLMRLLHAALVFENSGDEITWFQHFKNFNNFVEKFSFLLANSMSNTLLVNAYEALNAICTKFAVIEIQPDVKDSGFRDIFVQPFLVAGIIEAFKQMLPTRPDSERIDETSTPTQNSQKIMNLFLDINVTLTQYDSLSKSCYEPYFEDLFQCIAQILEPMLHPIYLFPITSTEQGFIENINEIVQALGDIFHPQCFAHMISIWALIETHQQQKTASEWENESNDDEVNTDDVVMTILEFVTRTSRLATIDCISNAIKTIKPSIIGKLYQALSAGESEPEIMESCEKFKKVAHILWNIDISKDVTE